MTVCFWKYCHYDSDLNRFFFHPVTVINFCGGFFFQIRCVRTCILIFALPRIKPKIKQSKPHRNEPMCNWRVSSACSTCATRRVTIVTKPVISHEWGTCKIAIYNNFHTMCYSFLSYASNVLSTIGCLFVLFPLVIGLSVLVRFTASD
jgi:hypothetical protein